MNGHEFWVGCNYWASNAGCHMWRQWDEATVRNDMRLFSQAGMNCLRVFLNWADFQPVTPVLTGGGAVRRYGMADGSRPTNPWYLDETMMERLVTFCDIAHENGLSLIVGPITGWMSGRLFVPPALYGVNLFTDPLAQMFEQLLIQGVVSRMKYHPAIVGWDHGNECDAMSPTNREEIINWTLMITNAIRAADPERPVVTGIHNVSTSGNRRIIDQGKFTDMLVSHPYPFWVVHARKHPILSVKTMLHAAAQTAYFSDVSGKPCLVEEIGTMGPMVCSEETAAHFLRINMLHAYCYNRPGMLWWNGFDQNLLTESPYLENSCERELGMFTCDGRAKAFTNEMTAMAARLKTLPTVTGHHVDAVCILTSSVDGWKIAYATFMLAVQAGISVAFTDAEEPLPDSDAYILPNVAGSCNLDKDRYDDLLDRVRHGAKLYLSMGDGMLSEFEALTGLCVEDSAGPFTCRFQLDGHEIVGQGDRQMLYRNEANGLHRHAFGQGVVYTLDFSPEEHLFDGDRPEESPYYHIYRHIFREEIAAHPLDPQDPEIGILWHEQENLCSIFNYSGTEKHLAGVTIPPYDGKIVPISK